MMPVFYGLQTMHSHSGDQQLFQVFEQIGIDFDKKREINFYFNCQMEEAAKKVQDVLARREIESSVTMIPVAWWKKLFSKPTWSVCATRHMPLDREKIMKITTLFQDVATKCGGIYDGWEASVMGDNIDVSNLPG